MRPLVQNQHCDARLELDQLQPDHREKNAILILSMGLLLLFLIFAFIFPSFFWGNWLQPFKAVVLLLGAFISTLLLEKLPVAMVKQFLEAIPELY